MLQLIILSVLMICITTLFYFFCYLLVKKENIEFKSKDINYIEKEILNKLTISTCSIKSKHFWLWLVYIVIGVQIVIEISERMMYILTNMYDVSINTFVEIISIIICALILFTISLLLGLKITMLGIKIKTRH